MNKKVALVILDGWGIGKNKEVDAIHQASTPFYDQLVDNNPNDLLVTYGEEVGLPPGQMGNSEVGHLNLGAGRIVYQDLAKINKAIQDNTLKDNEALQTAIAYAKEKNVKFHILGLLSDGGVHSHIDHLKAIVDILHNNQVPSTYIHAFMDGRDTSPTGGLNYMKDILEHIEDKSATLATMIGRYYAMDRDKRWERIKLAYEMLVHNIGTYAKDPAEALQSYYDKEMYDEFIPATVFDGESQIKKNDVVFFINFRNDRPRQLTDCLTQNNKLDFGMSFLPLHFVTMTPYDASFEGLHVAFDKDNIHLTLGEVLEANQKTQVRIAETEKYPHVTFFFSGGREEAFEGEDRILIPSPKVATYDLQPEMSAKEVTSAIITHINEKESDFICINYANTDMVGHTGNFEAAKRAAQMVDSCLAQLVKVGLEKEYEFIILADHGNADIMKNPDGSLHTAHTTNLVPVIYVSNKSDIAQLRGGKLGDIAPTILSLMGIDIPAVMDGDIIITKN